MPGNTTSARQNRFRGNFRLLEEISWSRSRRQFGKAAARADDLSAEFLADLDQRFPERNRVTAVNPEAEDGHVAQCIGQDPAVDDGRPRQDQSATRGRAEVNAA